MDNEKMIGRQQYPISLGLLYSALQKNRFKTKRRRIYYMGILCKPNFTEYMKILLKEIIIKDSKYYIDGQRL